MKANMGNSWLMSTKCLFVQLLGPLHLCILEPLSGPPFVPPATAWVFSVAGSCLWQSLSRLPFWEGLNRCPSAATWGHSGMFPSPCLLMTFKVCLELLMRLLVASGGSTSSSVIFSFKCYCFCPSLLTATSHLALDVVTIAAGISSGVAERSLAPPGQQQDLPELFPLFPAWLMQLVVVVVLPQGWNKPVPGHLQDKRP